MTTSYPGALDTLTNPAATDPLTGHAQLHSDVNDAVEAIEAKLGTGSSPATGASDGDVLTADGAGGSAWAPAGGGGLLQKATVTLSSADILDLDDTPVELVPSPGAGKWVNVHRVAGYLDFGTTPYASAENPYIVSTGFAPWVELVGLVSESADNVISLAPSFNFTAAANAVDDAVVIFASSAITAGDGTLTVTVYYTVEDVP